MESSARKKLNWFLSEFVVVVTGVLVALALNAAWQGFQDNKRGIKYGQRLVQDFNTTIEILRADSLAALTSHTASANFVHAFRRPEPPPQDSLRSWLMTSLNYVYSPIPLGTVEALVSSEDLQLISFDSLRFQLPRYRDVARQFDIEMRDFASELFDAGVRVSERIDLLEIVLETLTAEQLTMLSKADPLFVIPDNAVSNQRFGPVPDLMGDQAVYAQMTIVYTVHQSMAIRRNQMLEAARDMLALSLQ